MEWIKTDIVNALFTCGIPIIMVLSIAWNFIKKGNIRLPSLSSMISFISSIRAPDQDEAQGAPGGYYDQDQRDLQPVQTEPQSVITSIGQTAIGKVSPLSLKQVVEYLNDRRDDVPHWFCKGGSGSGKSTFIRLALAYRIARGEKFVIMTGKRTSVFDDLPCIGRDLVPTSGDSWKVTYTRVKMVCRDLLKELGRRDHVPVDQRRFPVINIVMDDASLILSEVEEAFAVLRAVGLLGRELNMRLIIATGSILVKELGLEGRSDLRDHFAVVTYNKTLDGSRETLLRPRYDDQINIPFDSSRVPDLSRRSWIDPGMSWWGDTGDNDLVPDSPKNIAIGGRYISDSIPIEGAILEELSPVYQYTGTTAEEPVHGGTIGSTADQGVGDRDRDVLSREAIRTLVAAGWSKNKICDLMRSGNKQSRLERIEHALSDR